MDILQAEPPSAPKGKCHWRPPPWHRPSLQLPDCGGSLGSALQRFSTCHDNEKPGARYGFHVLAAFDWGVNVKRSAPKPLQCKGFPKKSLPPAPGLGLRVQG